MKQKNLTTIIILIFTLLCATIYITYSYYSETSSAFKKLSAEREIKLVINNDSSYNELKNSIKEKYLLRLNSELTNFSSEYKKGIEGILGDKYSKYEEELKLVRTKIHDKKVEFLNSKEYLDKKQEMLDLKAKMDKAEGEEYDKIYEQFQKSLSEISTLNVKLNNSLKELKAKHEDIKTKLTSLFDKNKNALIKYRQEKKKAISEILLTIINEYNFEISELNSAFSRSQNKMREFPFDAHEFTFKSVVSPFESEYFNEAPVENEFNDTKVEFVDANFKEIN